MSIAKFNPNFLTIFWGPFFLTGFETGEFMTAALTTPERYTGKQAFGRSIHVQSTDTSGVVTLRFQADSPSLIVLAAQQKIDLAPGGNVLYPIIAKDNNGLDVVTSPLARIWNTPNLTFSDGEPAPREWMFRCEPLDIFHGGIAYVNG